MPGKVHVKGKRRAPPPPNSSVASRQATANKPSTSTNNNSESGEVKHVLLVKPPARKKSPAPPRPQSTPTSANENRLATKEKSNVFNKTRSCIEPNNLSLVNKFSDKDYDSKTIFNIVEPKHIRNRLNDEPILTSFSSNYETKPTKTNNTENNPSTSSAAINNKPNEIEPYDVWDCQYCTLENPFWKIVCTACERIRPFGLPTRKSSQIDNFLIEEVKLRQKNTLRKNSTDTTDTKRYSMDGLEILPYAVGPTNCDDDDTKCKRTSLIFAPKNAVNTLEMEKERLRAVIREMNHRAMTERYPLEKPNNLDDDNSHKYESLNLDNGETNKNTYKEIVTNNLLMTDDAKADVAAEKNGDIYYDFIGKLDMYCDQNPLGGTMRKLEEDIFRAHNVQGNKKRTTTKQANDLKINLFVNFNNAIEVNVRHNMTFEEFKLFVTTYIVQCRNPKIYFHGMLMQKDQTLIEYGINEGSALYINTENVTVDVDVNLKIKAENRKPYISPKSSPNAARNPVIETGAKKKTPMVEMKKDDYLPPERYQIEHIQLNRVTIERINPENSNLAKTKYRGVYNYNPRCNPDVDLIVKPRLSSSAANHIPEIMVQIPKKIVEKVTDHYSELLSLDNLDGVALNVEAFECTVCLTECEIGDGVVLRNCLHSFCKDCIRNTIVYSEEAEVTCPFYDDNYTCESHIQDREIKAMLTKEEHDEHLAKSLRVAENQIENSFHCRTPNCKGWCIFDDNVNQFKCPICSLINCLTCRVIHDGLNCKQYQDMIKNNVDGNPENSKTLNMLDEMIKNGEAMNCPTCRIVVMKKWGCDWLKCSMCKTEICWVTRMNRWGPGGKGDTSGGCKCGVNGIRCHPKCNYCH